MKPLKINPEYRKLVPPIKPEEYKALEADIVANQGCFESIKINKKDEILDGHNRFEICNKHALYFDTQIVDLPSVLDEEIYVIKTNLLRRQLNAFQKVEMAKPLENLIAEKAKQREYAGITLPANEGRVETTELTAKAIGVSKGTYERAKKVRDKGTEEIKKSVREGSTSISYAYQSLNLKEKHASPPSLPKGLFDVILADPPWKYDFTAVSGNSEEQYSTMSLDEICKLKIPSAEESILFLWATNPKIREALSVLEKWGYEYLTNMVWIKSGLGVGHYIRGDHELLLIGKKGKMPPPEEGNRPSSIIKADKRGHSRKPDEIYGIIEKMYPRRKYLELFARPEKKRNEWVYWGDEAEE